MTATKEEKEKIEEILQRLVEQAEELGVYDSKGEEE